MLVQILHMIRRIVSEDERAILYVNDEDKVTQFVNSHDAKTISQIGAACPDHLVHTKRTPLYIEWNVDANNIGELEVKLREGINNYREEYKNYRSEERRVGKECRKRWAP